MHDICSLNTSMMICCLCWGARLLLQKREELYPLWDGGLSEYFVSLKGRLFVVCWENVTRSHTAWYDRWML